MAYKGDDDACPGCGLKYKRLRTGLTYQDVWLQFWNDADTPREEWPHKSRGVILGRWFEIKQDLWKRHLDTCGESAPPVEAPQAADFVDA